MPDDNSDNKRYSLTGSQALSIHTGFILLGAVAQGLGYFTMPDWYLWIYIAVLSAVTGHKIMQIKGGSK